MADHVYKMVKLVGSSPEGLQQAIENAIARANQTLRNLRWFQVVETRGQIDGGQVAHWQVTVEVGFTLDDTEGSSAVDPRASTKKGSGRRR